MEWRGQSMGSGAGAVAKPAAGGPGRVEAGSVQQLDSIIFNFLYLSDFTPTCYCRRAVKSAALTGQELWS